MLRFYSIALSILAFMAAESDSFAQDVTLAGPSGCGSSNVTDTWTVPCTVSSITVEVYGSGAGAGGGGGGSNGGVYNTRGGGGGGGGGYSTITINVIPGSVFNYTAAQGGCGGDNGSDFSDGDNGSSGGSSTFSGLDAFGNPVNLIANGGTRGTGGESGNDDPGDGGAGGTASGGSTNTTGTAGSNGSGGTGGAGGAGAGPNGGNGGVANGGNGGNYGGGGAGGGDSDGGNGAPGAVLITYVTQGPLVPTVVTTPATCSESGTAVVNFYNPAITYTFTPSGPSVGIGGAITGMAVETDYFVIASIGNCTSSQSQTFSIEEQLPSPTITISGVLEYCEGSNTTLTASGAQNYLWDDQAGSTTAEIMVTAGIYTVTGTNSGCGGTETVVVTEIPYPSVDLGADQEICEQTTTVLDAGAGATDYLWSSGDLTQTAELGVGIHWVEASNGSCSSSDTIILTESQNPVPQITPSTTQIICDGGTVTLDAGSGYDGYLWQPNGEQTQTIVVSASGNYSATVTDAIGCNGSTEVVEVSILNVADAVISANGPLEICQGESVVLDAGAGYDTYLWSNGSVLQTTAAGVAGDYSVTGTLGGCPFASDTVSVSVTTFTPEIVEAGGELSVTGSYSTYQWYLNGDPIPGATDPNYQPIASGHYTIVVTDADGCSGDSEIYVFTLPVVDGIFDQDENLPFVVYPNPSNGLFQLELGSATIYGLKVMNAVGQTVLMRSEENGVGTSINLKDSGMYILQVTVGENTYHQRIIVH